MFRPYQSGEYSLWVMVLSAEFFSVSQALNASYIPVCCWATQTEEPGPNPPVIAEQCRS